MLGDGLLLFTLLNELVEVGANLCSVLGNEAVVSEWVIEN